MSNIFNSSFNSTETLLDAEVPLGFIHAAKNLSFLHASALITITAVLLGGSEAGRKFVLRTLWFFDRLLGGAPHTVDLPGPPGVPVFGNLLEVSCYLDTKRITLTGGT